MFEWARFCLGNLKKKYQLKIMEVKMKTIFKDDSIEINVYDIAGKRIRTLASGFYKVGIYNVVFDGSDLSSGIYLYEFRTSKKVNVKKMLLLK